MALGARDCLPSTNATIAADANTEQGREKTGCAATGSETAGVRTVTGQIGGGCSVINKRR